MQIITDVERCHSLLNRIVKKYGRSVEHHLPHYLAMRSQKNALVAFLFPGRMCALAMDEGSSLRIFPDGVFAPEGKRYTLLEKILDYALLRKKMKKVTLETNESFRKEILEMLRNSAMFEARRPHDVLHWPVFHMESFDHRLKGKKWKKMRNIRNRFVKRHRIRVVDSKNVQKEALKEIVRQWLRKRGRRDSVAQEYYHNVIDSGFRGFTIAKTIVVDGEPCTITAGWKVRNGKAHYYSAIGILNYRHDGLGEFANLMDLQLLKRGGYKIVDFGGSGFSLLKFKNKFRPHHLYKTYVFSIVKKS